MGTQVSDEAVGLRGVSVVRGGVRILDGIDLAISSDEDVAIIGPNGSGKSTLLKLFRGEIAPYYDEEHPPVMRLFGMDSWNLFELRGRMGIVSMDLQYSIRPEESVSDVILSGFFGGTDVYRNHVVDDGMIRSAKTSAVRMGVDGLLSSRFGDLSLGEMRRVLIARALVNGPGMLILDEPMTGLDIVMKSRFRRMFDILVDSGTHIVMITHNLEDISERVRRVIMVKDGTIFMDGRKEDVLTSENVSRLFDEDIVVDRNESGYSMRCAE